MGLGLRRDQVRAHGILSRAFDAPAPARRLARLRAVCAAGAWQALSTAARPAFFFLLGLLGYAVYHVALNCGEVNLSAGSASLIIATAPVFTAIFAHLLLAERLAARGWAGMFIAFAGVVLIVTGEGSSLTVNLYAFPILLAAIVTALYQVLQRPLFVRYTPVEVTAFATWAGTLPLLVFLPGFFGALRVAPAPALWSGLYLGIFPSALAYSLLAYAVSRLRVTQVAAFLYTVPIFGLLLGWLLLGEVPTLTTLTGGWWRSRESSWSAGGGEHLRGLR